MVALRVRTLGVSLSTPFWLSSLCGAMMPTSIGYQDLAALIAPHPAISETSREHMIASPFGTIEAHTFRYARPIGTDIPAPLGYQTVNFDPRALDGNSWKIDRPLTVRPATQVAYPTVNRRLKGDRLPLAEPAPQAQENLPQLESIGAPPAAAPEQPLPPVPLPGMRIKATEQQDAAPPATEPAPQPAQSTAVELPTSPAPPVPPAPPPQADAAAQHDDAAPAVDATSDAATAAAPSTSTPAASNDAVVAAASAAAPDAAPVVQMSAPSAPDASQNSAAQNTATQNTVGEDDAAIADQPPELPARDEANSPEPQSSALDTLSLLEEDRADRGAQIYFGAGALGSSGGLERWAPGAEPILVAPSVDPDIKLSALEGNTDATSGESSASKGDRALLESPAERLSLAGKLLAKAEKCLADAVYFEARGEPYKGQEAVAQVVMNRVFSGYYPNDVCGVVYQNANRHLACQFTFACEGKDLSRVDEPDMWEQAKRIAKDMLAGNIWLAEVGHATHYHAYWVHPSWVHEMTRLYKFGVHTFYRPRNWGDGGGDVPGWGTGPNPNKDESGAEKPDGGKTSDATKAPGGAAAPSEPVATKSEPTAKL